MEEKLSRHQTLRKALLTGRFKSQGEVVALMRAKGFEVTQSSISRDFRELGVIKAGGRYLIPSLDQPKAIGLQRLIKSIDTAGAHLVVVVTTSGAANAVAEEIDVKHLTGIAGTVAGDNTIIIATKNRAAQARVIEFIGQLR